MNIFIIIFVIFCIGGIVLFGSNALKPKKSREQFLQELERFFEGKLERIAERQNSYRITFAYEGEHFIYEDIETPGFRQSLFKTTLKVDTHTKMTLNFTEKRHVKFIQQGQQSADTKLGLFQSGQYSITLPANMKDVEVITDDYSKASRLFKNPAVAQIFSQYKNNDIRGHPFVGLKIINGILTLDFPSSAAHNPKPLRHYSNLDDIETLLDNLLMVVGEIKKLA